MFMHLWPWLVSTLLILGAISVIMAIGRLILLDSEASAEQGRVTLMMIVLGIAALVVGEQLRHLLAFDFWAHFEIMRLSLHFIAIALLVAIVLWRIGKGLTLTVIASVRR